MSSITNKQQMLVNKENIFVNILSKSFREFYFHQNRQKLIPVISSFVKDLNECSTLEELYKYYRLSEYIEHFNLQELFSLREITLIEDSAYFVRILEIEKGKFFDIQNKDILIELGKTVTI